MRTFFTADHHFGHANIIRHCNHPFANAAEMDEVMIANWNAVVRKDDRVIHVGDFAYKGDSRTPVQPVSHRPRARSRGPDAVPAFYPLRVVAIVRCERIFEPLRYAGKAQLRHGRTSPVGRRLGMRSALSLQERARDGPTDPRHLRRGRATVSQCTRLLSWSPFHPDGEHVDRSKALAVNCFRRTENKDGEKSAVGKLTPLASLRRLQPVILADTFHAGRMEAKAPMREAISNRSDNQKRQQ